MIKKKQFDVTEEGLAELVAELEELKSQRGEMADRIATAREFGDLSENSEYDAARSEQGAAETRIAEIEDILLNVNIIDDKATKKSTVAMGSTIEIAKVGQKKVTKYQLVGPIEADPLDGKISNESPIGKAAFGKKVGDKFKVDTPKGSTEYQIKAIN